MYYIHIIVVLPLQYEIASHMIDVLPKVPHPFSDTADTFHTNNLRKNNDGINIAIVLRSESVTFYQKFSLELFIQGLFT